MTRLATLDGDGRIPAAQAPVLADIGATATGEALIEAASAAAARTALGMTAAGSAVATAADASAQRTALGLGTAAVAATGDFATAAQGSAADAALPAANLDTAATALDANAASALRVQQDARLLSTMGTEMETAGSPLQVATDLRIAARAVPRATRVFPEIALDVRGDSLVESTGTSWPDTLLAPIVGLDIDNVGRAGSGVTDMLVRAGALSPRLTLSGGQIPATTAPVAVTAVDPEFGWRINGTGAFAWAGALAGVPGTLTHDLVTDQFTFARTTAGTAVNIPDGSLFTVTASPRMQILLTGRNNVGVDLAESMALLRAFARGASAAEAKRVLVLGILNKRGGTESLGTLLHTQVTAENARGAEAFGESFYDWRAPFIASGLVIAGLTATGTDTNDISTDTPPDSLMADTTHPNAAGYGVLAYLVAHKLMDLAWVDRRPVHGAVITSDTFNRADTSAGTAGTTDAANGGTAIAWTVNSQLRILSNQLSADSVTTQRFAYLDSGQADVAVQYRQAAIGSNSDGPIVRMTDTSNYVQARFGSNGTMSIYKVIAGTSTAIGQSVAVTLAADDIVRFEAVGTTYRVFVNDALLTEVAASTALDAATLVGVRSSNDTGWRIDDFLVERLNLH